MSAIIDFRQGWDFMSSILGANIASEFAIHDFQTEADLNAHIRQINDAIQKLSDDINKHAYRKLFNCF